MRKCLQKMKSYFSIEKRIVEYFGKRGELSWKKKQIRPLLL